jgi:hypothetical protein
LKIDALGLVTHLGAEEMDRNIGQLVSNPYFDYLPLFGGFVVCGDHFTLYNNIGRDNDHRAGRVVFAMAADAGFLPGSQHRHLGRNASGSLRGGRRSLSVSY